MPVLTILLKLSIPSFGKFTRVLWMLNFSENKVDSQEHIETIVIGCEGGFHEDEVALFKSENMIGFDTPLVLKSESAVCAVASKVLL